MGGGAPQLDPARRQQVLTLLRDEIDEFATTGRSLMPEGFEKAIPPERMTDLLAFLATTGKPSP